MNRTMPPDTSTADLVHELGLDRDVRIAVVADDSDAFDPIIRAIQQSDFFDYDVQSFIEFSAALTALEQGGFHLAFVDHRIGSETGQEFVRQAQARAVETPIIIMVGQAQRRVDMQVIRDGGADVVLKDDLTRSSVVERIIRHTLLRTRHLRELQRRASCDDLTGLANRTFFRSVLERGVETARRTNGEVSVVYIDLDGFKAVNDRYGHQMGDAVLQEVARRTRCAVGDRGLVARLGGDEFAVVVEGGTSTAKHVQSCVHQALEPVFRYAGRAVQMRASAGSATYPRDGTTPDRLVDHADRMMYGAKQRAASQRTVPASPERWWRRLQRLVDDFPRALENDELHLVFQPQLDDVGGRVRSIEALLRWQHPSLGLVSPAEFIPAIERCGLSYELDTWVIQRALEARRAWTTSGAQMPRMAINVSARSLVKATLPQLLNDGLASTGQCSDDIEIELTETAVLEAKAAPVMRELHASGIALAIDDFGVGQSSLASLAQTPASVLKLDRTLLVDAALDDRHERVLRWAIRLGRDLGMEVVAEGIEAESQLELLREEEVDGYQGFLLARPLPANEVLGWLTSTARRADSAPPTGPDAPSIQPSSGLEAMPLTAVSQLPC